MHRAALHIVEIRDNEWWSTYVNKDAGLGKAISRTTDYPTSVGELVLKCHPTSCPKLPVMVLW